MFTSTQRLKLILAVISPLLGLVFYDLQSIHAQRRTVRDPIAAGAQLFRLNCSSSYCHGERGKGGGAPRLQERVFSAGFLDRVIKEGIPRTAMPGFRARFRAAETRELIAYVLSLSAKKLEVDSPVSTSEELPGRQPHSDEVDAGRQLFFDVSESTSCRVCHTFEGKGGKVGPDLTRIGIKDPGEILDSIVKPAVKVDPNYVMLAVTLRDGRRFQGIKRDENGDQLRLFDTSTMPPVSRAIPKGEITKVEKISGSAMPDGLATRYSGRQLRELVAFLRSGRREVDVPSDR